MCMSGYVNYPIPGEKYQHYKGGKYEVICLANHTDDNEPLVIYKSLSFGSTYARPLKEWFDIVDTETFGGKDIQISRFQKV